MPAPLIFTDTSAWFAYLDQSDAHHAPAARYIKTLKYPLVTSTYVLDESLTLIKAQLGHAVAIRFGESLLGEKTARLLQVTLQDQQRAWEIFVHYADKGFSFTDCTSFALMDRLQIVTAFTFDQHFRQYGKLLVPG